MPDDVENRPALAGNVGVRSVWRKPELARASLVPGLYLLVEALNRHHHFYRDTLTVECPTGSGRRMNLLEVAQKLERRLVRLFLRGRVGPAALPRRLSKVGTCSSSTSTSTRTRGAGLAPATR